MSKHHPGPWRWSDEFLTGNDEKTWSLLDATGYGILSCDGTANSPQELGESGKFDAALIAAAPAMLEALEMVRDYVVTMKGNGHEYQLTIDAVIRAAKGEA